MSKETHHHGNLRAALIEAALELLQEGGIAGLTLRKAAARAGVSHAAPAHHFDGLPGLLTATAACAFDLFTTAMTTARDSAADDPKARLHGIAEGYLTFAKSHRGLFDLMFNSPTLCREDPELKAASWRAYLVLRDGCAPFHAANPAELELTVWSLVHGYAALQPAPVEIQQAQGLGPTGFSQLLHRVLEKL